MVSTLRTIDHLKGVPRLRDAVLNTQEIFTASQGCMRLDQAVKTELGASAILREHLKSPKGQKALLQDAYDKAMLMSMDKSSCLSWWGKLMRKRRHGFKVKVPIGLELFRAMWMYNEMESEIYDPGALELFSNICLSTTYKPLVDNASTLEYEDLIRMFNTLMLPFFS